MALEKYKAAITIDPNFAPAYREIAELYFLAGQPAKSIENWKKYLELNNSDYARYRYMSALYTNKQYSDAVTEYEGLKAKGFKNLYFERLAGYSYAEMGDKTDKEAFNKGLVAINKFFEMAPQNFKFIANDYKYKGVLLSKTGKDSIALVELEKAIVADPTSSKDIYTEMGVISYRAKKYDKVVVYFERKQAEDAKALNNNDYFNYGRANYNLGQKKLEEAMKIFKLNAAKNPDYWVSQLGLARGYAAMGDLKTALKYAHAAKKIIPKQELGERHWALDVFIKQVEGKETPVIYLQPGWLQVY